MRAFKREGEGIKGRNRCEVSFRTLSLMTYNIEQAYVRHELCSLWFHIVASETVFVVSE